MAMAELYQDLIVEILLCLPVISLLRFRSLSKSMYAFIDGSYFVNSHLSKSSQNFNLRKIIFNSTRKFHVCDMNLEEKLLILDKPFSFSQKEVLGYCKGLVLLCRSKFGLALWNPSTRRCWDLPDYPFNVRSYTVIASGLGYDDSIHDYKVIIMICDLKGSESEIRVWIYQLKSNIWIRVQNFPYLQYQTTTFPDDPDIGYFSTDGSLNWLYSLLSNNWQRDIVSFDMRKETFSIMPQPVYSIDEEFLTGLHVLEGFLAISYFFYPCSKVGRVAHQADLYIRKKDGADDVFIWTKLFSVTSVEPLPLSFDIYMFEFFFVLGYSKGGDKVLLKFENFDYFALYDLKEKSLAKVEVDKDVNWFFSTVCVESLVPVTGGA